MPRWTVRSFQCVLLGLFARLQERRSHQFSLATLLKLVILGAVVAILYGHYLRLSDPYRAFSLKLNQTLSDESVRHLDLRGAPIHDAGLGRLKELPELDVLLLGTTTISDDGLERVTEIKSLRALSLPGGVSDDGVALLRRLPRLEILDLQECSNLTPRGLGELESFGQLRLLLLSDTAPQQSVDRLKKALPACDVIR